MSAAQQSQAQKHDSTKKDAALPSPSASVVLISPHNKVLLLARVANSSSFASAHVFPGGKVDPKQDADPTAPHTRLPGLARPLADRNSPMFHEDGPAYRLAAIRETFEETGILLARDSTSGQYIGLEEKERDEARKAVHEGKITFGEWMKGKNGMADIEGLIPATRWITPAQVPKRYTTQMYIYFLPLAGSPSATNSEAALSFFSANMEKPTPDGGVEHTTAAFEYASEWIARQDAGKLILYPPQTYLLHLVEPYLPSSLISSWEDSYNELEGKRQELLDHVSSPDGGDPSFAQKVICPKVMKMQGQVRVMDLSGSGPELRGTDKRGDSRRVTVMVLRKNSKTTPKRVDVRWRNEVRDLTEYDNDDEKLEARF